MQQGRTASTLSLLALQTAPLLTRLSPYPSLAKTTGRRPWTERTAYYPNPELVGGNKACTRAFKVF